MRIEINVQFVKKCLLIFCIFLSVVSVSPNEVIALESSKCDKVLSFPKLPQQVDKAAEDYSFHYATLVSLYSGIYRTIETHCPEFNSETLEFQKKLTVSNLRDNYPSNQLIEEYGLSECLLSHFYVRESFSDPTLNYMSAMLDRILPVYTQWLKRAKQAAQDNQLNLPDNVICERTFELTDPSDNGKLTSFGDHIFQAVKEAEVGISKANEILSFYCTYNKCDYVDMQFTK